MSAPSRTRTITWEDLSVFAEAAKTANGKLYAHVTTTCLLLRK